MSFSAARSLRQVVCRTSSTDRRRWPGFEGARVQTPPWLAGRAPQTLSDERLKLVTAHIKALADEKPLELNDVDDMLRRWASEAETVPN